MNNNANLQKLIDKVKSGTSTTEEELALVRFLNLSMKAFLAFTEQLKITKTGQSVSK